MSKYRVALVGCGWVSGEHLRAYQNNPSTEVAALCSLTKAEAEAKATEWQLSIPCFDNMEEMMKTVQPDIVSVTSRPDFHVEHGLCAIEHGAQLVMEKPVALTLDSLETLVNAVDKNKTKSIVSFVLRWNPLYSIIRSLIDDDALGNLFYGEVDYYHGIGPWYKQYEWNITRKAGGSSLLSAGCHAIDGLVWFMGSRVTEVQACSVRSSADVYKPYEYDPTIVALCKFDNGRLGKVTSCIEGKSPYMFPIRLFGSKGTIQNNQIFSDKFPGQTNFATIPTIMPDSGDVTHHPFQGEIDHFIECLDQGKDSSVPIRYAAHIMKICYAAEESAQSGKPIQIS